MAVYVKPGVYSQYVRTAGSVRVSSGARVVAIIGVGLTYFTETDEAVERGGSAYGAGSIDSLAYSIASVTSIGDYPGGSNYTEDTDFQIVDGKIDWSLGGSSPSSGATYYVTYRHNKASSDYDAQLFTKISDIENEYGKEKSTTTITVGAKIANENGAYYIVTVQVTENSASAFNAAIDKLKYRVGGVDPTIIVALSTSSTVQSYLKSHVELMSSQYQKKERFGIIGMAVGTSQADVITKAEAIAYNRIILPYEEFTRTIKDPDTLTEADHTLDGTFAGCAIAGMMTKYVVQEPLTRKTVNGFKSSSITSSTLETDKDLMAASGVLLFEENAGIITIRHGMTTNVSTSEDNEISVMLIRDHVIKGTRTALDALYIGTASVEDTNAQIETDLKSILNTFKDDGSITKYDSINVTQNSSDSTRWDVEFRIYPAYPINYIYITFTI